VLQFSESPHYQRASTNPGYPANSPRLPTGQSAPGQNPQL